MARYYKVSPRFWSDPKVSRWDDDARLLALYLLTSPHRTTEGLFRLPRAYARTDLGWTPQRFAKPFEELLQAGFIEYDEAAQVCLIVNALRWQAPDNGNQAKAAVKKLEDLPETPLAGHFRALAEQFSEHLAKALPERFGERNGNPLAPAPTLENIHVRPEPDQDGEGKPDDTRRVFDAWIESTGRTGQTQLSPKRRRLIKAALAGYPLDDVLAAVKGWRQSPHHRGENKQGTVYNDLELLLRDAEHIERFRDLHRGARRPTAAGSSSEFVKRRGAAA